MSIKLNGSSAGSVSFDAPADTSPTGTDVTLTLPTSAGSANQFLRNGSTAGTLEFGGGVLQVVSNFTTRTSDLFITNTAGGQAAQYGLTAERVYGDLETLTITPKSSTSTLVLMATAGQSSMTRSNKGAEGLVFVKDNTTGYEYSPYPQYDPYEPRPYYGFDRNIILPVSSGNTNAQTWYLKGFSYNEATPSSSNIVTFRSSSFVIMEVIS